MNKIFKYIEGEITKIEELEETQLDPTREEGLLVSHYKWIISTSNI